MHTVIQSALVFMASVRMTAARFHWNRGEGNHIFAYGEHPAVGDGGYVFVGVISTYVFISHSRL